MTSKILKRVGLRTGLAMTAALALCAFAAVGSASAATQHWAGSSQVPYGSSQSFTGKATGLISFNWEYFGVYSEINCSSVSTSGSVANPAGGGGGTIGSEPLLGFQVGNCNIGPQPNCSIKNETISFSSMSETTSESGKNLIRNLGNQSGHYGEFDVITTPGATKSCKLSAHYTVVGQISATALHESPGEYGEYAIKNSKMTISGEPFTMNGRFGLYAPSGEGLVLSSSASPGVPHWYLGSDEWTTFATGASTAFASNGSMSLDLKAELFGVTFEVSCVGAANGVAGSFENPSGGGAGKANATFTFGACSIPKYPERCIVQLPFHSTELSGVATEVGGTPAVEFSPVKGTEVASFTVSTKAGAKTCIFTGSHQITGKLLSTSGGYGYFNPSASELRIDGESATTSGSFALETAAGKTLRLQP